MTNMPRHSPRSSLILSVLLTLACLGLPLLADTSLARPMQAVVTLAEPTLHPPLGPCEDTYWYLIDNLDDYDAILTLNALNPLNSSNWAEWLPVLPEAGYYRVEAYIPAHDPITWCTGDSPRQIADDTTDARYTIHHALGQTTVSRSQAPLADEWLDLGEYFFNAGSGSAVVLTDLNGETEFSTTISFSAMRFTWTRQPPQMSILPLAPRNRSALPSVPWVEVQAEQGFDACYIGSPVTMQIWWDESPYRIVGLYIGGVHYPDSCSDITADWVAQVRAQGWSFIPTWVGPQAPCTSYKHKMSSDPALSYLEGRLEADLASQAALGLGLANYGVSGTMLYYDLEAYSASDADCQAAVLSFLNGWSERLHELYNRSGVYSVPCSTYASSWASLQNPPDDVWLAVWDADEYDPEQTVFDLPCFSNNLYADHQRIKQYAGSHSETWGDKKLSIDCNVADAEVAVPDIPLQTESVVKPGTIQQVGWLNAQQAWVLSDGVLFQTSDGGLSWQPQPLGAVDSVHMLPSGAAWVAGGGWLHTRQGWAESWQGLPLPGELEGWRVVQVGFDQTGSGWLVMQQPTSAIFSLGRLLRTADGGGSWQVYDLPLAEPLTWSNTHTAWQSGGVAGSELYRSSDGGKSWQALTLPGGLVSNQTPVLLSTLQPTQDGSLSLTVALARAKIPELQTYTSGDAGLSWQLTRQAELVGGVPSLPLPTNANGFFADGARLLDDHGELLHTFPAPLAQLGSTPGGLAWVLTRQGSCTGEKNQPGFACASTDTLWLSLDGGKSWQIILP